MPEAILQGLFEEQKISHFLLIVLVYLKYEECKKKKIITGASFENQEKFCSRHT